MQKRRREFLSKTALGAFLLPFVSNLSLANFLPKRIFTEKKSKITVKINTLAVKRNQGE